MSEAEFIYITGASSNQAKRFLSQQNNQLEAALSAFYDSGENPDGSAPAVVVFAPPPVSVPIPVVPIEPVGPPAAKIEGATLETVSVNAVMEDLTVDVCAVLQFQNKRANAIEANFQFRASEATVYSFDVDIAGKKIVGQCKAKEKALDEYDDSISAGGRGFLLQKEDAGVFSLSLGNLGPNDKCTIAFRYVEDVKLDEQERAVVVIPLVALAPNNGLVECSVTVMDNVKGVLVPSGHDIEQKKESDRKTVVRVLNGGQQRELRLAIEPVELGLPFPTIEEDKNTTAVSISFVPQLQSLDEDPMTEVIFLIDRSGSMAGSRMRQTKAALQLMLRSLPAGCTFDLVSFGTKHESLFGKSVVYNAETFKRASEAVDGFDSNMGGTELLRPLSQILARPDGQFPRQILLLTDGDVSNVAEVISAIKSTAKKTRVFSLGIGSDASPLLIHGVAKAGGGESKMAYSGERLEPVIAQLCARIFRPAISSVSIDWTTLTPSIKFQAPSNRGVVFAGQKISAYAVLFENDKKKHKVSLTIGVAGSSTSKTYQAEIDLAQSRQGQTAHRLAVRALVNDFEAKAAPKDLSKADITALACKYSIASSLTSLIAVDMSANRAASDALVLVAGNDEVRDSFGKQASAQELNQVKDVMNANIASLMERGSSIETLVSKTEDLEMSSKSFAKRSSSGGGGIGGFFSGIGSAVSGLFSGGAFYAPAPPGAPSPPPPPLGAPLYASSSSSSSSLDDWGDDDEKEEEHDRVIAPAKREELLSRLKARKAMMANDEEDKSSAPAKREELRSRLSKKSRERDATEEQAPHKALNDLLAEQDKYLDEMSKGLEELESLSVQIGTEAVESSKMSQKNSSVIAQNARVDRVFMKEKLVESRRSRSPSPPLLGAASGPSPAQPPAGRGSYKPPAAASPRAPSPTLSASKAAGRGSSVPAKSAAKPDPNARPLDRLIRLCSFDGFFDLGQEFADVLGVSLSTIQNAKPENVSEQVWCTVLALELLQRKFLEFKQEWEMLAKKSMKAIEKLKVDYQTIAAAASKLF